ncbi:peptide/nickel transport system ATP-binding protein [Vibrio xiamenensis]|uniref:Peptide/nickel transport system ATP-binding protein n=1 Tax=Vibrio xiamenensis TaxID=861298 RepID=A0A1G7WWF0_9VIBR|nr:ABC transporter ATP-binding protein [Vibrio xiamenensis]SDG76234.1 peptide/nickel transport system ATP-binding protein [Vibrio xiamenensis]SDG87501.1 peptide/nickel transport system ATP-binding protein [Vibrio xiamenensis]
MQPLIEISDFSLAFKVYGGQRQVLHRISLHIHPGERVALIGESGSGKSVTSKMLMGTLNSQQIVINSGDIKVDGESLLSMEHSKRESLKGSVMSMIQQDPQTSFNPVFRIRTHLNDIMKFVEKTSGVKYTRAERKAHILAVLDKVKLTDTERVYNAYPWQLSGGMRQRVLIAMALLHPTKLLIADEPGTALDVTTQDEIIKLINQLVEDEQLALLMITHNLGVVRKTADRVYVMQHGRIVEHGSVANIFDRAKHSYTQRLFDSVPRLYAPNQEPKPPSSKAPLVRFVETCKTFHGKKDWRGRVTSQVKAVKPLNLSINQGDTFGLAGESGSGKTTLARMLMGIIDCTDGNIMIEAKPLATWRANQANRHSIQMVHQNPAASLNPRRTIAQTLSVPLKYIGKSQDIDGEIRRLLELVELPQEYAEMYPSSLSGGQKQRVAIARALAANPKILVLDEPTSALDVSVQKSVIELLERLQSDLGLTYLFISHDLSLMRQFCNRVAVMYRGELLEVGDTQTLFDMPNHNYTRALIRAIPVISEEEERHKPYVSDADAKAALASA